METKPEDLATSAGFSVELPEAITTSCVALVLDKASGSYADGDVTRLSPTSGRGPTLELDQKPDLLAPSDVMVMIAPLTDDMSASRTVWCGGAFLPE